MTLSGLIETHGYWVLAVGCLLEGETVLLLAGFAAHRGHLDFAAVVAVAAVCGFIGDECFFWLGRRHGAAMLARWPAVGRQLDRVQQLLARWRDAVVVLVRFAYGLRTAGPVIIGMSAIPPWRFAFFNGVGALLWAVLVGGAGWLFGEAAESVLGEIRDVEGGLLLALALGGAVVWAFHRWRSGRKPR